MRGLGRNSGNDLVLAVRPGWTHSVVLKISVVSGFEVYDAAWLRNALADRKIEACIPSKSNRKTQIPHDRVLYRKRHKIENMFGNLKDWRRIHTRSDPCAPTFMSAIAIAAIVIFWIWSMGPEPMKPRAVETT